MDKSFLKPLIGFNVALDIIIADQLTKWLVLEHIVRPQAVPGSASQSLFDWFGQAQERLPSTQIEVAGFFNWVMVWNEGISFGLFSDGSTSPFVMIAIALLITGLFSVWLARAKTWFLALSLALVIGGAIGNIIDRVRFGAVADFLDFHVAGYHWPAFNLADSCITIGVAFVILDGLFLAPRREKPGENGP